MSSEPGAVVMLAQGRARARQAKIEVTDMSKIIQEIESSA